MTFKSLFDTKESLINLKKSIYLIKDYDFVAELARDDNERKDLLIARIHLNADVVEGQIQMIHEDIMRRFSSQSDLEKEVTRNWINQKVDETNEEIDNISSNYDTDSKRKKAVQELITRIEMFEDYQHLFKKDRQR